MDDKTIKVLGALAHIAGAWAGILGLICSIILIATAEKNRHAKILGWQGLFWVIAVAVIGLITAFFFFIPVIGTIIWWLIQIAALVVSILYALKIYKGKDVQIPLVSGLARKVAKE
jgi:uncharacterized membrane protein